MRSSNDPTARRPRTERPTGRGYELTARDHEILRAIGRMKLASSSLVRAAFFGSRSGCTRRLAKLFALGLITVHVVARDAENIYGLTATGRDLLVEEGHAPASELHLGTSAKRPDLGHLLAVNSFRIALTVGARRFKNVRVVTFLADWDLRRVAGLDVPPYIPDALIAIQVGERTVHRILEADAGTESPRYFAKRSASPLLEVFRARAACWGLAMPWRPLLIAPTLRRCRSLARTIVEAGAGELLLIGCTPLITGATIFGTTFATATEVHAAAPRAPTISWKRTLFDPPPGCSSDV